MPLRSRQPPTNPAPFTSPAIRAGISKPRYSEVNWRLPAAFSPPTSTRGPRVLQGSGQGQAPQGAGEPTGPGCEGRSAPDKGVCAASGRVKKRHEIGLKLQGQPSAPAPAPSSSGPPAQRAPSSSRGSGRLHCPFRASRPPLCPPPRRPGPTRPPLTREVVQTGRIHELSPKLHGGTQPVRGARRRPTPGTPALRCPPETPPLTWVPPGSA